MKKSRIIAMMMLIVLLLMTACSSNQTTMSENSNTEENGNIEQQSNGEQIVIKFAHSSAPESARDQGAKKFKEVIEAETNGQVKVEIYPASQLGSPTEIVQGVQTGSIEMSITPTSFMGGFEPLITLLDIPYLFPVDKDKLIAVQEGEAMREILDKTENIGIKTLGIWHTGYKQFTGPKPLNTPDAFKDLKFRAMASPVIFEQFRLLGASPTDLPFSETYNALQNGTIDAQENPLDTTYDMKLHEVQDFTTMTNHGVLDQMILVNKNFYDSLDENIKNAMDTAFKAGQEITVQKTYENIEEVRKIMEDSGMEFVEITEEERKVLEETLKPIRDFYISEVGEEGKKLLEALEAEIEEIS